MTGSYNPLNNRGPEYNVSDKESLFRRVIKSLTNYGMKYDDMVYRNRIAVGMYEDPRSAGFMDYYESFSSRAISSLLSKKSISYFDKSYKDKKRILREFSIKDEISDFITIICNECIVYNDDGRFCEPKNLPNTYSREIIDRYMENFENIYNKLNFNDSITAWNVMRDFLIDGYVAYEIVYDDKRRQIIDFNRLKPETLVPAYEPHIGYIWIQYPEDASIRRLLLDNEIIYISYSNQNEFYQTSYVEGLIKPYNQLKLLELSKIIFNILNARVYQKFDVPVDGLSMQRAKEIVAQLMSDYYEHIEWDDSMGVMSINGTRNIQFNKQYWFPASSTGSVKMELVSPQGHNLNESDMLKWFYDALKRASKVPFQRLDKESGGGNLFKDASEMTRDEITFSNFTNRIKSIYKEIITKPLRIQMLRDFPELSYDMKFINSIDIVYNSNHLFEEWKKLSNLEKRVSIANNLLELKDGETPYFHIEFIVDHILKLTQFEKDENLRYKKMFTKKSAGNKSDDNDNEMMGIENEKF